MDKRRYSTVAYALVVWLVMASSAFAQAPAPDPQDEPSWWEEILQDFFCWILGVGLELATKFGEWFGDLMPTEFVESLQPYIDGIGTAFNFANYWTPAGFTFKAIAAYWTFAGVVVVYRAVKSWIPTVSG